MSEPFDTTVLIPTCNERDNVFELVRQLEEAFSGQRAEVLFVDDSSDDTPAVISDAAGRVALPVRVIHREGLARIGGLSGAVAVGLENALGTHVVVMDGDLQHPPALAPALRACAVAQGVDVVAASRYCGVGGDAGGLSSQYRRVVSSGSTVLARAMFPRRVGRYSTDPMTGFFCVRREAVDLERLRPRGFKILLEILASHDLRISELPFVFGERLAGDSKASWRNGVQFVHQLCGLRAGRGVRFAAVGGVGFAVNLVAMAVLLHSGMHYATASLLATELAIVNNFLLQERFVFPDLRAGRHTRRVRALQSFAYNNADALVRLPFLVLLVERLGMGSLAAQALTLVVSFGARFVFNQKVVYRPRNAALVAVPAEPRTQAEAA